MGTVNYTIHQFATGNLIDVHWASISTGSGAGDTGQWFPSSVDYGLIGTLFSDKSVQVYMPSGSDAQVIIQGCNQGNEVDPANYVPATLTDAQGNALLFTPSTQRIEAILENPLFIRPMVSTVSSTTLAANVHLILSSTRPARSGM